MAFVSNKQKNINAKNINAKYGRKKFFIIFTLFCLVAFITLLALSIFLGGTYKQISFVEPTMPVGISYFGWVMACSAILLFIMIIVSIVFLAKFESLLFAIIVSNLFRNSTNFNLVVRIISNLIYCTGLYTLISKEINKDYKKRTILLFVVIFLIGLF